MKRNYYLSLNNKPIKVIGETVDGKNIHLSLPDGEVIGVISSHPDDLDTIQRKFSELNKENKDSILEKVIEPIDVIKGLENIIKFHPNTKNRLASLKSQVYNVLLKNNLI